MSVTIKNLDMPIGCQKCKFFRKHMFGNGLDYSYSCILGAKEFPMPWIRQLDNRAVDCPIIEADKEAENDDRKSLLPLLHGCDRTMPYDRLQTSVEILGKRFR